MKSEKGITLLSLVVYVAVMTIIIGTMSIVTTTFYSNMDELKGNVQEVVEFCKFNNYFLKEVKSMDNKVTNVSNNYLLFATGNSFSFSNSAIYYNNIKICDNVENIKFNILKDKEDAEDEYTIINVEIEFKNFDKAINYKLENIY